MKINIPDTNDMNLPGQKAPWNPLTDKRVASMNAHVIGTPHNIKINRYLLAHGHMSGPLVWIQTMP